MSKLNIRDLKLVSYGYALRTADEILKRDRDIVEKLNLSEDEYNSYRHIIARQIVKDSDMIGEDINE